MYNSILQVILDTVKIKTFVLLIIFSLASIFFDLLGVYFFYLFINSFFNSKNLINLFGVSFVVNKNLVILTFIFFIFRFAFITYVTKFQINTFYEFQKKISNNVLDNLLKGSYLNFCKKDSNLIYNFFSKDVENLTSSFQAYVLSIVDIVTLFLLLTISLYTNFTLNLIIYSLLLISAVFYYFLVVKKYKIYGKQKIESEAEKLGFIENTINGYKELKVNNHLDYFLNKFSQQNQKSKIAGSAYQFLQQLPKSLFETIGFIMILLLLLIKQGGQGLIPDISLVAISLFKILPSVNRIINYMHAIKYSEISIFNLNDINDK